MEELSADLLDELDRQPIKKKRKTKVIERSYRAWFYEVSTNNGDCDNPDCADPRKKARGVTMVWTHPSGLSMCRYCFLDPEVESKGLAWLKDE